MKHASGKPIVVLSKKLKAKREFRLFRFGDNPSSKGTYRLTPDSASRLMALYQRRGLKVTFDFDHAALKHDARPGDGKAAGNCELELRDDGIWCTNVSWTPSTQQAVEEGEWIYFSPAFLPNEDTKEIEELVNVALTNIPAMEGIEPIAANRNTAKLNNGAAPMNKKMSEHLKKFVSGGGKLEDCSKGTGIHIDRMKQLHDGEAPSNEEMKALAKHFKFGPEQMKEFEGEDSNIDTGRGPTPMSAMDGQDPDDIEGEGDDEVEHEDLEGGKPNMLRRSADNHALKLLTMLTGTADPKKQAARVKAMAVRAAQQEEDHAAVEAIKMERTIEKRNRLIEKGKANGQITPKLLKWAVTQDVEALEEFLKVAPVALSTRGHVEADPENMTLQKLTREDVEAAKLFGITNEQMAKAKEIPGATDPESYERQRRALIQMYSNADAEGYVPPKSGHRVVV